MAQGGVSEKQLPAAWVLFLVGSQERCKKNKRKKQTKEKVARASKILEKKASSKNKAEEKNKLQEHARHARRKHGARANTRKQ